MSRMIWLTTALACAEICALGPTSGVVAQAAGQRLAAPDMFELEYVADPQISPDGSQVVYVRRFGDVKTDQFYTNLWIVDFDGTGHRPLTTGLFSDASPAWSPTGDRIVFVSDQGGSTQLHVRWMDTGQTVEITKLQNEPQSPAWSPDGRQIAFTSLVSHDAPWIIQAPSPPEGAEWAPPARVIDKLVYRFDGKGELDPGYSHIFVVPASGGTPRQVSSGDFHHGGGGGRGSGTPVWTPDGRHILISANRRPDWELENRDTEVYEFAVGDGAGRALTGRKGPDNEVAVAPNGRRIAYVGYDDRYQGYQVQSLYVANRDGSDSRVLTSALDRTVRSPLWSPDGDGLYFLYDDRGNTKLAFATLDGDVSEITGNVGGSGSAYASGTFSLSGDGRFAMSYTTPQVLSELAVGRVDGGQGATVVTEVNADLLDHKVLGDVEEIWYPSSHDGLDIQGWIIKPPGFDSSRRYPLILEIHGGPFANYGDRFDVEKQVMAARGYVVLYTNPRGSTSYGGEFGNLIHHAYPGDDFYDLDSGVNAVIERGYVDPDQLFVTGGSGGGVLSTWTIGRTNRYKAAAVLYPVINWYSFAVTSDIPVTVNKYWFPTYPWEDPEGYMRRSTISLVGNVTTPTMIMTGSEDWRTPMSETEQYYQALKLRGIESVLVQIPEEPHGLRRRPSHFMQKIMYIVGWFDRYRLQT